MRPVIRVTEQVDYVLKGNRRNEEEHTLENGEDKLGWEQYQIIIIFSKK